MSLFAESAWEPNAIGDKFSEEIAKKKCTNGRSKKLSTNNAKRKAKKRQKASLETVLAVDSSKKELLRQSKNLAITADAKLGEKGKKTSAEPPKSRGKRRKPKRSQNEVASDEQKKISTKPVKKFINGLNVKQIESLLAKKDKAKGAGRQPESLRERMLSRLRSSRFRFLNESLYTNASAESKQMFKENPDAFAAYHAGYKQQVEQWPLNPLDVIIASVAKMPKDCVIADFGCGEARLAESVSQRVHSFDLVAVNERVRACDMAHTPLLACGVNVVVFCLSLMGNNLADYLLEANRVLKTEGIMKIAEIESRFGNVEEFVALLKSYGFVNTWKDFSHNLFYFMDFKKVSEVKRNASNLPTIELKPCLYKKR